MSGKGQALRPGQSNIGETPSLHLPIRNCNIRQVFKFANSSVSDYSCKAKGQMNTRKAILTYQYAERIKSELIIASNLLAAMDGLEGNERLGAEKMMVSFLEALTGEIRIAQHVERSMNFIGAERKIMEAIGKIGINERSGINQCISEALSLVTTCSSGAMKVLMSQQLI